MANSKARVSSAKPDWRRSWGLHPEFPLFPLGNPDEPHKLRWAKKVRGKLRYLGKMADDPKGQKALEIWNRDKDELIAGRTPRAKVQRGLTVRQLCNLFLTGKRADVDSGRLSPRTFSEYHRVTNVLADEVGRDCPVADLGPDDFEKLYAVLAGRHVMATLGREVAMIRSLFKYVLDQDLIDRQVRFGARFKVPTKTDKRKYKARQKIAYGAKLFEAAEVNAMLGKALPQLRRHDRIS